MDRLLNAVLQELDKKLAENIKIIDFNNVSPFNDYFVVCTARNIRHALSLIRDIKDVAGKNGFEIKAVEGDESSDWLLVDLYSIVIHIFVGESRSVYQLEKLWGDLPVYDVSEFS